MTGDRLDREVLVSFTKQNITFPLLHDLPSSTLSLPFIYYFKVLVLLFFHLEVWAYITGMVDFFYYKLLFSATQLHPNSEDKTCCLAEWHCISLYADSKIYWNHKLKIWNWFYYPGHENVYKDLLVLVMVKTIVKKNITDVRTCTCPASKSTHQGKRTNGVFIPIFRNATQLSLCPLLLFLGPVKNNKFVIVIHIQTDDCLIVIQTALFTKHVFTLFIYFCFYVEQTKHYFSWPTFFLVFCG